MALWGFFLYLRGSNPSPGYLGALILDEAVGVIQGLIGGVLLLQGHRPPDALHFLYGFLAVVALPVAYFLGSGGVDRRDSGIFGLAGLLLVGVAIRGTMTGGGS
jgi:heme A synthase